MIELCVSHAIDSSEGLAFSQLEVCEAIFHKQCSTAAAAPTRHVCRLSGLAEQAGTLVNICSHSSKYLSDSCKVQVDLLPLLSTAS